MNPTARPAPTRSSSPPPRLAPGVRAAFVAAGALVAMAAPGALVACSATTEVASGAPASSVAPRATVPGSGAPGSGSAAGSRPGAPGTPAPGTPAPGTTAGGSGSATPPAPGDDGVVSTAIPPGDPGDPTVAPVNPTRVTTTPGALDPHPTSFEVHAASPSSTEVEVRWYGGVAPCSVLARVDVVETAATVTITVFEGASPHAGEMACILIAQSKSTVVTLAAPLGGRTIVDGSPAASR